MTQKNIALFISHEKNQCTFWCPAKDFVALRDEPTLPEKKLEWLQRHDKESGNVYGLLPLIKGLPVALTDHVDPNTRSDFTFRGGCFSEQW